MNPVLLRWFYGCRLSLFWAPSAVRSSAGLRRWTCSAARAFRWSSSLLKRSESARLGRSISWVYPRITPSGLLISCATPEESWPRTPAGRPGPSAPAFDGVPGCRAPGDGSKSLWRGARCPDGTDQRMHAGPVAPPQHHLRVQHEPLPENGGHQLFPVRRPFEKNPNGASFDVSALPSKPSMRQPAGLMSRMRPSEVHHQDHVPGDLEDPPVLSLGYGQRLRPLQDDMFQVLVQVQKFGYGPSAAPPCRADLLVDLPDPLEKKGHGSQKDEP